MNVSFRIISLCFRDLLDDLLNPLPIKIDDFYVEAIRINSTPRETLGTGWI